MDVYIETPRLIIRKLGPGDIEGMFAMDRDPELHKWLGNNPYKDITQSKDNVEYILKQYEDHGIGRWAVIEKDTKEFVGWTGFKLMTDKVNGHVGHYDFGYRHRREYWGKGYGYEAAKAALDYGIDAMKLRNIYAMTDVNNAPSRGLLEKLGFEFVEVFGYDGTPFWREGLPVTWYKWSR